VTTLRFTDAQIFFVALLGFCLARLSGAFLMWLTMAASADPDATLLARVAPSSSISPIYLFFVLLPVALAVFAIGIPFLLRTLLAAARRRLTRTEAVGLVLVAAVIVAALVAERWVGGASGILLPACMATIGFWQSWRPLGQHGGMLGLRLLAGAGLSLGLVAYYEAALVSGAEPSIALAPTFVVLAVALGAGGLPLVLASALARAGTPGWPTALLAWPAAAAWCWTPGLRATAAGPWPADRLELRATIAVAALLVAVWAVAEFRSGRRDRSLAAVRSHTRS